MIGEACSKLNQNVSKALETKEGFENFKK